MKRRTKSWFLLAAGVALLGSFAWMRSELAPTAPGEKLYYHLSKPVKLGVALQELQRMSIVRDGSAMQLYAWVKRAPSTLRSGTYLLQPGMSADDLLSALERSIHQNFRFPETNWARRNANLLQRAEIADAKDYLGLVKKPSEFQRLVDFPLPKSTLEGYLYPDTYQLAPLTGAKPVIDRQLKAFEDKVVKKLGPVAASDTIVRKASLVELETGTDHDRPLIAGVIENRLKKGMPLQIDAGIEYALGKWRRLYYKDYKGVKSPYNLYLHKGLPPTPICSPSYKSIVAALHPAKHKYLYYVAMPDGHSIFAATPAEHEHNIRLRKLALAARAHLRDFLGTGSSAVQSRKGRA